MKKITKNFSINEFKNPPDLRMVLLLQNLRESRDKKPIYIISNEERNIVYSHTKGNTEVIKERFNIKDDLKNINLADTHKSFLPILGSDFQHDYTKFNLKFFDNLELCERAMVLAMLQIGYHEGHNNDNHFGKHYGINNVPWCAFFLHWCWEKVSIIKDKPSYVFGSSQKTFEALPVKKTIEDIVSGDGVFWAYAGNSGHTAIAAYNDKENKVLYTIEGNSGDAIYLRRYPYALIGTNKKRFLGGAAPYEFTNNLNILLSAVKVGSSSKTR